MTAALKTLCLDFIRLPAISVGAFRVWQRNFYYFKKFFISSMFWNFTEPVLYVVAFGYGLGFFVGKIEGVPYIVFFAPAVLAITAMQSAVFESTYSAFTKLQNQYETILMTPVSIEDIVVGEVFWGATKSFFSVLMVLLVFIGFGMIESWMIWLALPVMFLLSWCMSALAMVVTSYARDYDSFTYFFSLAVTPMTLLSGTFFPMNHFPQWGQVLAWFLPLTHGVNVIRSMYLGQWNNLLLANIAFLLVLSVLLTNWACAQMRRRLIY